MTEPFSAVAKIGSAVDEGRDAVFVHCRGTCAHQPLHATPRRFGEEQPVRDAPTR